MSLLCHTVYKANPSVLMRIACLQASRTEDTQTLIEEQFRNNGAQVHVTELVTLNKVGTITDSRANPAY